MGKLIGMVAMTPERVIGRDGDLPWHLPEDLRLFKRTTTGHPIVMGRKTFDSIGRPLPNRRNIVITRNSDWKADGVEVISAPEDIFELLKPSENAFIIGGAEIYRIFLPLMDELLVSWVFNLYPGDTRFPLFEDQFPSFETIQRFEEFELRRYPRASD